MGQGEVIEVLKKMKGKELTTPEICEHLDISVSSVQKAIQRILKNNLKEINYRELTFEEKKKKFGKVINSRVGVYWVCK